MLKSLSLMFLGDASHITAPSEDGHGAEYCMKSALRNAQVNTTDVGYINAHATSTPLGRYACWVSYYFCVNS